MKRTAITFITLFAVTAARASDLATTFYFDPSLSREANPTVALFGAGPQTMILANIVGVLLLLFVPLFLYWRGRPKKLTVAYRDIWEFAALYLYDRAMTRRQLLTALFLVWPLPRDGYQFLRLWGLAGSWGAVVGSFAACFSWWAISGWHWSAYHAIYKAISIWHYPLILPVIAVVGGIFGAVLFFRLEYAEHQKGSV